MKINIKRYNKETDLDKIETFNIENKTTILEALNYIKREKDSSISFRCGCKSGVCGSCAVRVNNVERLACKTSINENDLVEPIKNSEVIKDLITNIDYEEKVLKKASTYLEENSNEVIYSKDEKQIDLQSNCILCQSCYSSCPVYEVNEEFLGPYALTRALRYVDDKKVSNKSSILASIQENGIWDCTLCSNCTMVCPQFIDPKTDIMNLRMKSVQVGYEDKSIQQSMGFDNFDSFDSGFDPSGGFNPNGF